MLAGNLPPIPSSANCTLFCRLGDDGKLPPRRGALLLSATEGADTAEGAGDAGNGNGAADAGAATSNSPNAADAANDADDDGCTLLERGCGDMFDSGRILATSLPTWLPGPGPPPGGEFEFAAAAGGCEKKRRKIRGDRPKTYPQIS